MDCRFLSIRAELKSRRCSRPYAGDDAITVVQGSAIGSALDRTPQAIGSTHWIFHPVDPLLLCQDDRPSQV